MSWSFTASGRPKTVAKKVEEQFSSFTLAEPEKTIADNVKKTLIMALEAYPEKTGVRIRAFGSQTPNPDLPGKATNNLTVELENLYGFIDDSN